MPVLDLPQATVHYHDEGTGEPLLLLSANPGTHRDFAAVIPALAQHYRVIAPDWPGYGASVLKVEPGSVSATFYRDILEAFITALALPPVRILGNSLGGNAAVRYALAHPARVQRLVLVSPGGFTPHNRLTRAFCRWQGSRWSLPPVWFAGLYLRRRHPMVREMLARAAAEQSLPLQREVSRAVWRSFTAPDHDLRGCAAALAMPALLVFGRYDPVIPPWLDGRVAKRCLPQAGLAVLPTGHAPFAESPPEFLAQVLPFLSGGLSAASPAGPGADGSGVPA